MTVAIAPSGNILSSVVDVLKTMLSNCASFQTLVQAASASAALARIHEYEIVENRDGAITRPFAIVHPPGYKPDAVGDGAALAYAGAGTFAIGFEVPVVLTGTLTGATDANNVADTARAAHADDYFNGMRLVMKSGTYAEQSALISDFTGATGAFVLGSGLGGTPAVGNTYRIEAPSTRDAYVFALNVLGSILANLKALSGQGGYFALRDLTIEEHGLSMEDKDSRLSEYYLATLTGRYGR